MHFPRLGRQNGNLSRQKRNFWHLHYFLNDVPIGFLFDKTSAGGNPILRILKPSGLKGMNMSDRAPKGLFVVPDLPQKYFGKVKRVL